jgi:hypothetical protein
MQKPVLGDPPLLINENAVHDRDLPGRAAEAERRHTQPDPERLCDRGEPLTCNGSGFLYMVHHHAGTLLV